MSIHLRLGALAVGLATPAAAAPPDVATPVQQRGIWSMVEIAQEVPRGTQILTMLGGPHDDMAECELFRAAYTNDGAEPGDRVLSSACGTQPPPGSLFAALMRGRPFPVVVFADGRTVMAIANAAMTTDELAEVCDHIRQDLHRGTCHIPDNGGTK